MAALALRQESHMKRAILGLSLAVATAGLISRPAFAEGVKAPDFTLKDMNGKIVHLHDFRGKVVLVNFWATWCPPCRYELPTLSRVYDGLKKKGFVILGVSLDEDPASAVPPFLKSFRKEHHVKMDYPMLVGDEKVADAYGGIRGIPTTFIVDRKGIIRDKFIGPPGDDEKTIQRNFWNDVSKLL